MLKKDFYPFRECVRLFFFYHTFRQVYIKESWWYHKPSTKLYIQWLVIPLRLCLRVFPFSKKKIKSFCKKFRNFLISKILVLIGFKIILENFYNLNLRSESWLTFKLLFNEILFIISLHIELITDKTRRDTTRHLQTTSVSSNKWKETRGTVDLHKHKDKRNTET